MEHVGIKDAPFHGAHLQARVDASKVLNHLSYDLNNRNVFNATGPTTVTITQGYALPSDPDFQQPSTVFIGGIRSLTLGLKPVF